MKKVYVLIFGLSASSMSAQSLALRDKWADSVQVLIDTSVRHGDMKGIDNARTILERVLAAYPGDPVLLHYDAYALYRKVTLSMSQTPDVDTRPMLDKARSELETSARKLQLAETYALQSSVLGQIIARSRNPITAMTLGMKSGDATTKAIELAPKNPRVWMLRGIGAIFTPSMWGGGLDKAQEYLEKAVTYFENDNPQRPMPAWGKAEAFIWLGQVYAKQNKTDSARAAYSRAVEIEPDNGWARALLTGRAQPVVNR